MAFISGPAAKRIFMLSPNRLLNADSRTASVFGPPNVCAPAMKVSSDSCLAPATSWSKVSAASAGRIQDSASRIAVNDVRLNLFMSASERIFPMQRLEPFDLLEHLRH
jgi:hypothetical protein